MGTLTLDVTTIGTHAVTTHDETEDVVGLGPTLVEHEESLTFFEQRLTGELGITPAWAVGVMLPWRTARVRIHYLDGDREVTLVEPSIHHRNETLTGMGDPYLWARWSHLVGPVRLGLRAGVSLPAGRTEDDPYRLEEQGLPHQHVQFGTGTFNPLAGVEALWQLGGVALTAWFFTEQILYANPRGFRAGDRYSGSLGARTGFGSETLTFEGAAQVQAEGADHWPTPPEPGEGNRGRVDLFGSLGGAWRFHGNAYASAAVKLPIYQHVVGEQRTLPFIAMLGIGAMLDFGEEQAHDHGHDHAHEDEHVHEDDAHGVTPDLDRLDLAAHGEAVELVPVQGKVTVFDFWAEWCVPCHALDAALVELLRRYPGQLAVRRIDVGDGNTPAAERYLTPGGFALPHIKVYDASGRLVLEQTGGPDDLAAQVEATVRRASGESPTR